MAKTEGSFSQEPSARKNDIISNLGSAGAELQSSG